MNILATSIFSISWIWKQNHWTEAFTQQFFFLEQCTVKFVGIIRESKMFKSRHELQIFEWFLWFLYLYRTMKIHRCVNKDLNKKCF